MVGIWVMRMTVFEPFVLMTVRVRFARRIIGTVFVLMVFIVTVPMFVGFLRVHMRMRVGFRYVQPHSYSHKSAGYGESSREGFMQENYA